MWAVGGMGGPKWVEVVRRDAEEGTGARLG